MLDLRDDIDAIYGHIIDRVERFDPQADDGPGDARNSIALVTLGFSFGEYSWLSLIFDTRSDADHDGEWTTWTEENEFCIDRWDDPIESLMKSTADSPLTIQTHDGSARKISSYDPNVIADCIGELLVHVVTAARKNGVFKKLPLKSGSTIGIEEFNGYFGWPLPDDVTETGAIP